MGDRNIEYNGKFGIGTFQFEITKELGDEVWDMLIKDSDIPDMDTESGCQCKNMASLMERFDRIVDKQTANRILSRVRHGLKPSHSAWAREKFLKYNDLDAFINDSIQEGIADFDKLYREGKDFYGQPITKEVLDFIKRNPGMISAVRDGNKLYITAYPANISDYLNASDSREKRYHACHCPFAKESILAEHMVSSTLCYCSLGHVKNFWEAAFDTELEGEVVTSALNGDMLCTYVVFIPDEIMKAYVES